MKRAAVEQLGNARPARGCDRDCDAGATEIQDAIRKLIDRPGRPRAGCRRGRLRQDRAAASRNVHPLAEQAFFAPLFDLLKANNDKDPYLRHAAVMGLVHAARNPVDLLERLERWQQEKYDVPAVRMGVVLALRKHEQRQGRGVPRPTPSRGSSRRRRGRSTTSA